jgi:phenylacetate-CoA ligase
MSMGFGEEYQEWLQSDARQMGKMQQELPEQFAEQKGREKALATFQAAAATVPAYQRFLAEHDVDASAIKTWDDFLTLPLLDKKSYLIANGADPIDMLVNGSVDGCFAVARSSGTSGDPIYFPRYPVQDAGSLRAFESMWVNFCDIDKHSTLLIDSFDFGMWIAAEVVADIGRNLAKKYGTMTVATPGSDIDETLGVIRHLARYFEQTIIVGYPPFIRQLFKKGEETGIDWKAINLLLLPGGEGFSEQYRSHMLDRIGKPDSLTAIVGAFGCSEGMVIGIETPLSIAVRRMATESAALRRDLYGRDLEVQSLIQYSPMGSYLETVDGEIVMTTGGAMPLVRYNTHDMAGAVPFGHVMSVLEAHGCGVDQLTEMGVVPDYRWTMPFMYTFGRGDSVSVDGAAIYSEGAAPALLHPFMHDITNWKLAAAEREDGKVQFTVLVELERGLMPTEADARARADKYRMVFLEELLEINPDFRSAHRNNPECLTPEVLVYTHGEGPFESDLGALKQRHIQRDAFEPPMRRAEERAS